VQSLANSSGASSPRVLLMDTARWAAPARLAVDLSRAGADVSFLCPRHHPVLKARAVARTFHFSSLHPLDSIQAAIEASSPDIVVPCDDRSVQFLHELHARAILEGRSNIAGLISHSLGPLSSFPIVSSRYALMNIAREEGLLAPDTHAIETPADLARLQGKQRFAWVMKVDGTSGGRGVKFAQTPQDAERFLLEARRLYGTSRILKRLIVNRDAFLLQPWWNRSQPAVIAQAYISGRPANCAVVCWEGRVLAGISVHAVSAEGAAGQAIVVRVVDSPDMMQAAERIASRLHLSGFFGLDFVIEEGTGNAYLIEMNPRSTPLCHLRLGKGRDMIGALCAQLSGEPLTELAAETENDLIAYFPQAWISKSEYLQSSFQDIPRDEPELAEELLRPWPNRSFIYTLYQFLWTRLFQRDEALNAMPFGQRETPTAMQDTVAEPSCAEPIPHSAHSTRP
jgi:hypothetical protein